MRLIPNVTFNNFIDYKDPDQEGKKYLKVFDPMSLGPKEIYMSWEGLSRAPKRDTSKALTRTFTIIGIVVALFLILMQYGFLVIAVASLILVNYLLSKTPAEVLHYEISSHGVSYGSKMYYWPQLKDFYFAKYENVDILCIDTYLGLPGRLFISVQPDKKEELITLLSQHILYLTYEPKTFIDKAYEYMLNRFTLKESK